jgi:hypothetical protein
MIPSASALSRTTRKALTQLSPGNGDGSGKPKGEEKDTPKNLVLAEVAFHGLVGELVRLTDAEELNREARAITGLVTMGNLVGGKTVLRVGSVVCSTSLFAMVSPATRKARFNTYFWSLMDLVAPVDPLWAEGCVKSERTEEDEDAQGHPDKDPRCLVVAQHCRGELLTETVKEFTGELWEARRSTGQAQPQHVSLIVHLPSLAGVLSSDLRESVLAVGPYALQVRASRAATVPLPGVPDGKALAEFRTHLRLARARAEKGLTVKIEEEAGTIWAEGYKALSAPQPGLVGQVSRYGEAMVLRLALAYCLLEPFTSAVDTAPVILPSHLASARAVWDYSQACARAVFGNQRADPLEQQLLEAIEIEEADGLSKTDAYRKVFAGRLSAEQIDHLAAALVEDGVVMTEQRVTKGRPKTLWKRVGLVPTPPPDPSQVEPSDGAKEHAKEPVQS